MSNQNDENEPTDIERLAGMLNTVIKELTAVTQRELDYQQHLMLCRGLEYMSIIAHS